MNKQDDGSYPLGASLSFLQRLWQLNHVLEKVSSRMEKSLGVTAQQRLILRCVGKYPGMTAGHLASLLRVDPGTVSASLGRLENKGLLDRRRDPHDKRRAVLRLTAKGRAMDRPADGTVESTVDRLLEGVRPDDLASMMKVVDRFTGLLSEQLLAEGPLS